MAKKIVQFEIEDYSELTDEQLEEKLMVIGFKVMKSQMEENSTEDLEKIEKIVTLQVQALDITRIMEKRIGSNEKQRIEC